MNAPLGGTGVIAARVSVAVGGGILARRANGVLYVADDGPGTVLLDAFAAADDRALVEAVTDASVDAGFSVAPFAVVTWDEGVTVVVQGALEVRTDDPSLPMLSGAGSGSWVERRLRLRDRDVTVSCGADADESTDLALGRVGAGGFSIRLVRPAVVAEAPDQSGGTVEPPAAAAPATEQATTAPSSTSPPAGPSERSQPVTPPSATPDPTSPLDRMAALRAALRAPDAPPPPAADTPPVGVGAAPTSDVGDDRSGAVAAATNASEPDHNGSHHEVTILGPHDGATPDGDTDDDGAPMVTAVRCLEGHLNPPHVGACRTCGGLLPPASSPEVVRQPPLALLQLDDGETFPIDRTIVVGRKPQSEAAQFDGRARLVTLAGDPSVSRTHLRIDVEDWTLTVTDCGSRSGSAIVARPGEEPRVLEPWVPHELPTGARLFLGGPTSVTIHPIVSPGSR